MTSTGRTLRPGEDVPLDALGAVPISELVIGLDASGSTPEMVAMLVGDAGQVRSGDDLIFYNNVVSADGAVHYQGQRAGAEWVRINPAALDADVAKVVFGCAGGLLDQPGAASLILSVLDGAGAPLASAQFSADEAHRAMILFDQIGGRRSLDLWPTILRRCRLPVGTTTQRGNRS